MESILGAYRELSKEELYEAIEMLYFRVPKVRRALEAYLDDIEIRQSRKRADAVPEGSIELEEQIISVRGALVSLSYEPYIDDQPEIDDIYNAVRDIPEILKKYKPTFLQAELFKGVIDEYWDVLCQTGLETECQKLAETMSSMVDD